MRLSSMVEVVQSFLKSCRDRSLAARQSSAKRWEQVSPGSKTLRLMSMELKQHLTAFEAELQAWQEYVAKLTTKAGLLKDQLENAAAITLQHFARAYLPKHRMTKRQYAAAAWIQALWRRFSS